MHLRDFCCDLWCCRKYRKRNHPRRGTSSVPTTSANPSEKATAASSPTSPPVKSEAIRTTAVVAADKVEEEKIPQLNEKTPLSGPSVASPVQSSESKQPTPEPSGVGSLGPPDRSTSPPRVEKPLNTETQLVPDTQKTLIREESSGEDSLLSNSPSPPVISPPNVKLNAVPTFGELALSVTPRIPILDQVFKHPNDNTANTSTSLNVLTAPVKDSADWRDVDKEVGGEVIGNTGTLQATKEAETPPRDLESGPSIPPRRPSSPPLVPLLPITLKPNPLTSPFSQATIPPEGSNGSRPLSVDLSHSVLSASSHLSTDSTRSVETKPRISEDHTVSSSPTTVQSLTDSPLKPIPRPSVPIIPLLEKNGKRRSNPANGSWVTEREVPISVIHTSKDNKPADQPTSKPLPIQSALNLSVHQLATSTLSPQTPEKYVLATKQSTQSLLNGPASSRWDALSFVTADESPGSHTAELNQLSRENTPQPEGSTFPPLIETDEADAHGKVVDDIRELRELRESPKIESAPILGAAMGISLSLLEALKSIRAYGKNSDDVDNLAATVANLTKSLCESTLKLGLNTTPEAKRAVKKFTSSTETTLTEIQKQLQPKSTPSTDNDLSGAWLDSRRKRIEGGYKAFSTSIQATFVADFNQNSDDNLLQGLHDANAAWNSEIQCLKDTRVGHLTQIRAWSTSPGAKPIYWLRDLTGSGKSTIAHHLAKEWSGTVGNLGGSFFFAGATAERSTSQYFCTTLARHLADRSPALKIEVCSALRESTLPNNITDQFQRLILEPITKVKGLPLPLVFVIDSLDECKDRAQLITTIQHAATNHSSYVKFFVVSSAESDLSKAFNGLADGHSYELTRQEKANLGDIKLFIEAQLAPLGIRTLGPRAFEQFAERSGGLFIWASTICKIITMSESPANTVDALKEHPGIQELDELYRFALTQILPRNPNIRNTAIKRVLGVIVAAQEPLSASTIDELLGVKTTARVIEKLGCVLTSTQEMRRPVEIRHPTFRDFITRDPILLIEPAVHHQELAKDCLDVMERELKRDICLLSNPFLPKQDVQDLHVRKRKYISPALDYASRFWGSHVIQAGSSLEWSNLQLTRFFEVQLLEWLEVMSYTEKLGLAVQTLEDLQPIFARLGDEHLSSWCKDALQFIDLHSTIITKTPLQLYTTALEYTPTQTLLYTYYTAKYPSPGFILSGKASHWSTDSTPKANGNFVTFSPDAKATPLVKTSIGGNSMVALAYDNLVYLIEVRGGKPGATLTGHQSAISSLCLSQDGTMVVSADRQTIKVWDTETGAELHQFPAEGASPIQAVAISPDEDVVLSVQGSVDSTISAWDVSSNSLKYTIPSDHWSTITTLHCARSGTLFLTSSADHTVKIRHLASGQLRMTLEGHGDAVNSATFSGDTSKVLTGSEDRTVAVWDTETGQLETLLEGCTDGVKVVAFLPGDNKVLGCLANGTVYVWDLGLGHSRSISERSIRQRRASLMMIKAPNNNTIYQPSILYLPPQSIPVTASFYGGKCVLRSKEAPESVVALNLEAVLTPGAARAQRRLGSISGASEVS